MGLMYGRQSSGEARVIERVTRSARWDERARDGRALGLAAHRSFLSYTAVVASVVKRPNGKIAVDEVWVAFDPGTIINTDRVRAQLEGSVIFGMSLALLRHHHEEWRHRAGQLPRRRAHRADQRGAATYLRGHRGERRPARWRGRARRSPVAPAIANAVFALTGKRVRELPLIKAMEV